jgi:hypothetical protein
MKKQKIFLPMNHIDKFQNQNEMNQSLMEENHYKQYVEEFQLGVS